MNDPVVFKNGSEWDDDRIERALSSSANATPGLSDTRRAKMLEALLAENARLLSQLAPADAQQLDAWNDDQVEQFLSASAQATPKLSESRRDTILQALMAEAARLSAEAAPAQALQTSLWDDARIDQALAASAQAVPVLSDSRKAAMLQAIANESARLASQEKASTPPKPSLWDRLQHLLLNPRALTAMAGTFAALVFVFAYFLLGGSRPQMVARANGSFSLSEARQGVLGLHWQLPRSFAGASDADIHVGDLVIATTPVTITFADGTQAIAAVGSQLRMLPDQAVELVAGELVADTSANTEKFTVQSIGASFVVTDATFRVKVDEAGTVSQYTDAGRVVAMTPNTSVEVLAGEQASVAKDSPPLKALQPPVVAGQKTDNGQVEFTARTLMSSTVVLLDSQTGNELARFKADENGIVNGTFVPPPGASTANLEFRTDAPDGRKSSSAVAVNNGNAISSAANQTILPPPPPVGTSTLPNLSLPALAPAQASSRSGAAVRYNASATDPVDGNLPINCNFASGTTFPIGLTEVNCSATNSQGRTATGSFKVSVVDTLPPIIRLAQNRIQAPADNANGAPVTFTVSAIDAVDGPVQVSCNARSGQTFPLGSNTVQCSATDSFGNATQASFEILVKDDAAPAMRLPDNMSVSAASRSGAEVTFATTASDQVDGSTSVSCSPASGSAFALGTTTVNCTTTDKAGNTSTGSFTVSVRDTSAPVMSVPDAINTQATSSAGAQVTFSTTASDQVDGNLGVSCSPRAGSIFPIGQTPVTCRVTDNAGNSATRSFNVNVTDSIAPKLNLPSAINMEATGPNGAVVTFTATATDTVDGIVTTSCSPRSGSNFPLGSNAVTCRATDTRGNQATDSFNVVVRDTTEPVLTHPNVITQEATTNAGAVVNFNATARDDVDGAIQPACTPATGATFPLGNTTVRCTATDKAGNAASESFNVTIRDTKPPILNLPDSIFGKATSKSGAIVSFTVSASDAIDGNLSPVCTPRSGATFSIGDTSVTCRVTDSAGNAATDSFKVTVQNTTPPVLTLPANQTVEATGPNGTTVTFTPAANSIVDGPITPVCTPASGATFPLGTTAVTCRATDDAGNIASDKFNITVVDTTAPDLVVPATQTVEANNGKRGATVTFNATATDQVDTSIAPVCTPRSGSTFDIGTATVTCRVTDRSGNVATGTFNIVVQDTVAPVIASQSNLNVEATSSAGASVDFNVTANDAADGATTVVCAPRAGSTFPLGATTVNCTATDQAGKSNGSTFNVVVADTTAPSLNLPANITTQATSPSGSTVTFSASASDSVDGAITPACTPASGATFPLGATTVTCIATDKAGNQSQAGTFVVTVVDNIAPTVIVPSTITIQATSDQGAVVAYTVSANDNLDGAIMPVCTMPSGSTFPLGPTQVDCTAMDKAGNSSKASFTVVVTPMPTPTPTTTMTPTETSTPITTTQTTPALQTTISVNATSIPSSTETLNQTTGMPPELTQ